MSQTNPAHSASASALHIAKPSQGEHLVVQNTGNVRIECAFSAKEATLRQEGEDLIFTFSDGTSLTIAHYYATNAESSALPPLIMAGEAVQVPQLLSQEAAQQEAEQEAQSAREPGPQESPAAAEAAEAAQNTANTASKGKALPQNSGDAPSDSPTQQGQNAQNSSSTQASPSVLSSTSSQSATATATALDGGRFHNFDTNELLDGIHRLPGLDLPWGQKLHESKLDYSGLVEEDEIEADAGLLVEPAEPADPVDPGESAPSVPEVVQTPPTLVVDAARLTAEEAGVRLQNSDPNADFAGTALITGKVQGTDAESTDLEYGFLYNGSLVQTLTTSYGSVTMAPDGSYSYSLNNDLPEINTMKEGQQAEDSFTVAVSDGQGGMDSQVITVEIHGTNDMPTLQLTDISFTAYGKQTVFSGQAVGGDGDKYASWTYGLEGGKENPANAQEQYIDDTYGTLYIDTVTGVYRYELDSSKPAPAAGSTHECTVTVIVTDELGAHTDQALTVHLDGNGAYEPTPSISGVTKEAGVNNGGNTETPGTLTYTGKTDLSHTEFKNGSPTFCFKGADGNPLPVGTELQGTYGTFTLQADGTYTYTLDNSRPATQNLSSGEKGETEHAIIMVTSENGTVMEVPFEVEVQGTNDAPTIIGTQTPLSVTEPSTDTHVTSGTNTIEFSDDDSIETHYFSIADKSDGAIKDAKTMQGDYGILTIDEHGEYSYKLTSSPFQSGETGTDTFTIVVKDAEGAYDTVEVTVNVTGTSSAPVFSTSDSYAHSFVESGVVFNTNNPKPGNSELAPQKITITDPDDGDMSHFEYRITDGTKSFIGDLQTDGSYKYSDEYGTLTIFQNGTYTYSLDNNSLEVQKLNDGENITHTVYIAVEDSTGNVTQQPLTLTIVGSNDKPYIDADFQPVIAEDAASASITGQIAGDDYDTDDTENSLVYSIVRGKNDFARFLTGKYGTLEVTEKGVYTYTVNNALVQKLGANEYYEDVFTIYVKDKHNAFQEIKVPFTITGTDDAPVITQAPCSIAEDSLEPDFTTPTQKLTVVDVDENDTQSFSVTGNNAALMPGSISIYKIEGTYGFLLFNTQNGEYTYTLNNDTDLVQELNTEDHPKEEFAVTVTSGGKDFSHTITVTVNGVNDDPTITSALDLVVNKDKQEDFIVHGTAIGADIDDTVENLKFYMSKDFKQTWEGKYGSLTIDRDTGEYTYVLNQFDADYTQLVSENKIGTDEKFTLYVYDEHNGWGTRVISVTVNPHQVSPGPGENPPVKANNLDVTEDVKIEDNTGKFIDTADNKIEISSLFCFHVLGKDGKTYTDVKTLTDEYGALTINNDGTYTYTLNNDSENVQALHEGQKITITVPSGSIYLNGNPTTATITVTITGTNDSPKISVENKVITESADSVMDEGIFTVNFVTGQCGVSDIDNGDVARAIYYLVDSDGNRVTTGADGSTTLVLSWGTVVMKSDGSYTYTLKDNQVHRPQGKSDFEKFTVEVDDGSGVTTGTNISTNRGEITIEIKGDNQKPEITTHTDLLATEDTALEVTGKLTVKDDTDAWSCDITSYTDKDGATVTESTDLALSKYGTLLLKADGSYTYVVNNQHPDVQALGKDATPLEENFTITVTDKHGDKVTQEITVNISGTNDKPALDIVNDTKVQLIVKEDGTLTDSGTVKTLDVDAGDTFTYSHNGASVKDTDGNSLSDYGKLEIDQKTGEYTFTLNNAADKVNTLSDNDQLQFIVKLTTTDAGGLSDSKDITIVIKGTNDLPTITSTTPAAMSVTEGDTNAATGTITATDAENEALRYRLVYTDSEGKVTYLEQIDTEYGTMRIAQGGTYTYTLKGNIENFGSTDPAITETYTLTVLDPHGAAASTQDVTVTINGAGESVTPPAPTPSAPTPTPFSSPVETESLDALLPASVLGPEQGAAGSALAAEQGPGLDRELSAALEHASLADMQACLDAMPEVGLCSQGGGQGDAPEAYTPFIADDLPVDMPLSLSDKGEAQLAQEVAQRILAETGAI